MILKTKSPIIFLFTLYLFTFQVKAKVDWKSLTLDKYIDEQVSCQQKIKKLEWSHYLWPKENKRKKPLFNEVMNRRDILSQVEQSIKMQSILDDKYKIFISNEVLQGELDRMVLNTKDSKRLNELFKLFNYDANDIVECVVKPYLVHKKLRKQFNWDKDLHLETKLKARNELKSYERTFDDKFITASIEHVNYKTAFDRVDSNQPEKIKFIELSEDEFAQKSIESKLKSNQLQEYETAFVYMDKVELTDKTIKQNLFVWHKISFEDWLNLIDIDKNIINYNSSNPYTFKLLQPSAIRKVYDKSTPIIANTWKTDNIPDARELHSAIWTGTEMIIVGGANFDSSDPIGIGGRYNPGTDTWSLLPPVDVPILTGATVVWTGSEMIVWGGGYNSSVTNLGVKYNPITNEWTHIDISTAPIARGGHSAIWTGSEMIVLGGRDSGGNFLSTGSKYNLIDDTWTQLNTMNAPGLSSNPVMVWMDDKMLVWINNYPNDGTGKYYDPVSDSWTDIQGIDTPSAVFSHLFWSGSEVILSSLDSNYRFNPSSNIWVRVPPIPYSIGDRVGSSIIWTGDKLIIWGGNDEYDYRNDGVVYSLASDRWEGVEETGAPGKRNRHTAIWSGEEMIIWGGFNGRNLLQTGGKYNLETKSWSNVNGSVIDSKRIYHSSIWTGVEMIVWGGSFSYLDTGGRYNPAMDRWDFVSNINNPFGREHHSAIWTGEEMIVWGGRVNSFGLVTTNSGGRYNPMNNSWGSTSTVNAPDKRYLHTAIWTGEEMVIWGGVEDIEGTYSDIRYVQEAGKYNPYTNVWTPISDAGAPAPRVGHTAIWTGKDMIVWGGNIGNNVLGTGGIYDVDNDSWDTVNNTNAPSSRNAHTSVWTGTEMVVWGGYENNQLNTGGRYNPVTRKWEATSSLPYNAGRSEHSAIWTGDEMIIWGGFHDGVALYSGFRYYPDSDSWIATNLSNSPSARGLHTAVWTGREMIIWGGWIDPNVNVFYDTMGVYYPYSFFSISGEVSGLVSDNVILQLNNSNDMVLSENGMFTFDNSIKKGDDFSLSILKQPITIPNSECFLYNSIGMDINQNVTDVMVECSLKKYHINVTVDGLLSRNNLIIQNNNTDDLYITSSGLFIFHTAIEDGEMYEVSILNNPTNPSQPCIIENETGLVSGGDVLDVLITCDNGADHIYRNDFE